MSTVTPSVGSKYFGVTPVQPNQTLNMNTFMQLLTAQLQNQDPTQPMTDDAFFGQMAQLAQVQGMDQLQKNGQIQEAQSLMGKTVTATTSNTSGTTNTSGTITGQVVRMSVQNGNYTVGIEGSNGSITDVAMTAIQQVSPTPDMNTASQMIGKTATGNATTTVNGQATTVQATGPVTGVASSNGTIQLQVNSSQYGTVLMNIGDVTNITN